MEIESSIIKEMMDIVAKRDSLIALLEEDRLRLSFNSSAPHPYISVTHSIKHYSILLFFACVLFFYAVFVAFVDVALLSLGFKK